jgi:hypothetical protein
MGVSLLRSDANDNSAVGDFAAFWDLSFADEKHSFGSFGHAASKALG